MKEKFEWDMPKGVASWKQSVKVRVEGSTATKTVTRNLVMKDGTNQTLTTEVKKTFTF